MGCAKRNSCGEGLFCARKLAFRLYGLKEIYVTVGLVGKKIGMTRVFLEEGDSVAVTVLEVEPNRITLVKHRKLIMAIPRFKLQPEKGIRKK